MNSKTYLFYYIIILFLLILLSYLNKHIYNIFTFCMFTYALTNLYIKKCQLTPHIN